MNERVLTENSRLLRPAGILVAILSAGALIVGLTTFFGRQLFVAELFNNFRFQIALVILALCFPLYYCRLRAWSILQLVAGLVVIYPVAMSFVPAKQTEPGPNRLTLLSYNVLGDNPDKEPILKLMDDQLADVMIVIEFEHCWVEAIKDVAKLYSYSIPKPRWDGFGIAVFSKYKLSNTKIESLPEGSSGVPFVLTELTVDDQQIILAAGHFLSPLDAQRMQIRNDQIASASKLIREYRGDRDLPVLLAGDFNAVAWSPFIGDLLSETNLRDSRQGYLYHGSWPTYNFLLRIPIDNVFVSDQVHIHHRELLKCASSDHFPLLVEFSVLAPD